jgi:hypothetical protein
LSAGRRTLWPLALAAGTAAVAFMVVAALVAALFGASVSCIGGTAGASAAGPTPAGKAAQEIPAARLHIFVEAGRRFDISWPFLASIGVQECGTDGHCGVAESGCAGVMEIAYVRGSACSPDPSVPTLWERFRVDGDGDGQTSIFDPADAIFTAARIFRRSLEAPPAGGSYHGYYEAACGYYGACSDASADYAPEVMARAVSFGFGHEALIYPGAGDREAPARLQGPSCGGSSAPGGASGGAIVKVARSQLGVAESPIGSNCTKYGPCVEWCALFVAWVWEHGGVEMAGGTAPYAYSGKIGEWAEAHGGRLLAPGAMPSPGDAVLFGWGPTASEHVGIVESVFGDEITTIDGNFDDRVSRVGPFLPALAGADGEPAPIYAYAEPPGLDGEGGGS